MSQEVSTPSMETLASAAGVSTSTVSRALRSDPRISPQTREKICAIAARLGYRPNPLVSALMSQRRRNHPPSASCNLAWLDLFPSRDAWQRDRIHIAFYEGACNHARGRGFAISRIPGNERPPLRLAKLLHSRGIRGVLVPNFDDGQRIAAKIPLPLEEFAFVTVGARFEQPALDYASDDQYESSRLAVQQLWNLGYRRIGYFAVPRLEDIVGSRFYAGYHATLVRDFGVEPPPALFSADLSAAAAWIRSRRLDAVLTASRQFVSALREAGLRIPDDIGLAHLNVDDAAGVGNGELAGIRQNNAGVGATAVDLLIGQINHNAIGIPRLPRGVHIRGEWVPGRSAVAH